MLQFKFALVTTDGEVVKLAFTKKELEEDIAVGTMQDGRDGIGPIYVRIPSNCASKIGQFWIPNMEKQMEVDWDRKLTKQLVDEGIDWDKAGMVVGIVAEHRQRAYLQGYQKGYNSGYAVAQEKFENGSSS